ncbi:MAG: YheU family protein [Myxococcota bacterium]
MEHLVIPWRELSEGALRGVIEEFVSREGTEYGASDVPLEEKVASVRGQLERGEVVVLFDAKTSTTNLIRADELR